MKRKERWQRSMGILEKETRRHATINDTNEENFTALKKMFTHWRVYLLKALRNCRPNNEKRHTYKYSPSCLYAWFPGYTVFLHPERTDAEKNKTDYLQQGDQ